MRVRKELRGEDNRGGGGWRQSDQSDPSPDREGGGEEEEGERRRDSPPGDRANSIRVLQSGFYFLSTGQFLGFQRMHV